MYIQEILNMVRRLEKEDSIIVETYMKVTFKTASSTETESTSSMTEDYMKVNSMIIKYMDKVK